MRARLLEDLQLYQNSHETWFHKKSKVHRLTLLEEHNDKRIKGINQTKVFNKKTV